MLHVPSYMSFYPLAEDFVATSDMPELDVDVDDTRPGTPPPSYSQVLSFGQGDSFDVQGTVTASVVLVLCEPSH